MLWINKYLFLGIFFFAFSLSAGGREISEKIVKLFQEGNYKEAALLAEKILVSAKEKAKTMEEEEKKLGRVYHYGKRAYSRLGCFEEKARLQSLVMKLFPENLSILEELSYEHSSGYILNGKLVRGYPRGFRAKMVNLREYDRIRLLQHIYKAKKKFDQAEKKIKERYYACLAGFLRRERGQSWRLQLLTSLTEIPDYTKKIPYSYSPPPVDDRGEVLFYSVPERFEQAHNDGERLFYCWKNMGKKGKRALADFLYKEFDFSFLDENLKNEYYNYEKNINSLLSLKENETICRLASGVRKITLPAEYDYVRHFRELEEYSILAKIHTARLQFEKAVPYLQKGLKKEPGNLYFKNTLKNILSPCGMLFPTEIGVEGKEMELKMVYRNAKKALVTVRELDWKKLYTSFLERRTLPEVKNPSSLYSFMNDWYWQHNKNYFLRDLSPWKELSKGVEKVKFTLPLYPRKGHLNTGTRIKLDKITKAGLYLANVKLENGTECETLFCISKGLLLLRRSPQGVCAIFCDAETGRVLPGKKIILYTYTSFYARNPAEIKKYGGRIKKSFSAKEFTTDENGSFFIPLQKGNKEYILVSFDKEYPFLMNCHFRPFRTPGNRERTRTFFITDRPLYKGGDLVRFTGYCRLASYEKKAVEKKKKEEYTVVIRGPRNTKFYEKKFIADEMDSSFSGSFKLPEDAPLGRYVISGKNGAVSFRVEEYKKKEYELLVFPEKSAVKAGEKIVFSLQGRYFTSAPMNGAKISYKIYRQEKRILFPITAPFDFLYGRGYFYRFKGMGKTSGNPAYWGNTGKELLLEGVLTADGSGKGKVVVPEKITKRFAEKDSLYTIEAEIKDDSNSVVYSSSSVTVSSGFFHTYIQLSKGFYAPGEVIKSNVYACTSDGKKIQEGFVIYSLYSRKVGKNLLLEKGKLLREKKLPLHNDAFSFILPENGSYLLTAKVVSKEGEGSSSAIIFVRGIKAEENLEKDEVFTCLPLEVVRDKSTYLPGEKARFLISSRKANSTFFLFRHPCREWNMEKVVAKGTHFVAEMPIREKDQPNTFFEVMTVQDGKVYREMVELIVPPEKKRLQISLVPEKRQYSPGEKVSLTVTLKDEKDRPVSGVFTLAVYDKALEQISPNNVASILPFFWNWKRYFHSFLYHNYQISIPVHKGEFLPHPGNIWSLWFLPEKSGRGFGKNLEKREQDLYGHSLAVNRDFAPVRKSIRERSYAMKINAQADQSTLPAFSASGIPEKNAMENIAIRKDFADSLLWVGRKKVGKDGKAVISIPLSDDLTSYRIRCWGLTKENRVGEASSEFAVNKKLMARLTLPRFLVRGDTCTGIAHIHNLTEEEMETDLLLTSNTSSLQISGKNHHKKWKVPPQKSISIPFEILAVKEGEGEVLLKVRDEKSTLTDALLLSLPVLVKGAAKSVHYGGVLDKNTLEGSFSYTIPEKRKNKSASLTIRLNSSVACSAINLLPFLAAEKSKNVFSTVSRFLPAFAAKKVLDALKCNFDILKLSPGKNDPLYREYLRKNSVPVYTEELFRKNLSEGETFLRSIVNSDGGWGWFGGNFERSYPDTTAEVVEALQMVTVSEKQRKDKILQRGIQWLKKYISDREKWIEEKKYFLSNTDALVLKVLAGSGIKMEKMQKHLFRNRNKLSPYALSMLAFSFPAGSLERKTLIRNLSQYLVHNKELGISYLAIPSSFMFFWYGNENMTNSAFLELLLEEKEMDLLLCRQLAGYLAVNVSYSPWRNSVRSLGKVLLALAKYMEKTVVKEEGKSVAVFLDGKLWKKVILTKENMWKDLSFSLEENLPDGKNFLSSGKHTFKIVYSGKGELYYSASVSYFSMEEKISSSGREMKIKRNYYKMIPVKKAADMVDHRGQAIKVMQETFVRKPLLEGEKIQPGERIEVELVTESGNDYDYVCLSDPLPAGFEYVRPLSGYQGNFFAPVYCEYRTREARFYLRNLPRGKGNITYEIRAQLPGYYCALPAAGKGLYAPLLHCNTESSFAIIQKGKD